MDVLEFKKISLDHLHDEKWSNWSRAYEYPLVIDYIKKYYKGSAISSPLGLPLIHNSSWGYTGIHITFKEELERIFINVVHSDIKASELPNTFTYDIRKEPPLDEIEKYDFVLNISTMEQIKGDHLQVFNNLLKQVKKDGIFIATFDLPGLQLEKFEDFFNKKIETNGTPINGANSCVKCDTHSKMNCGIMVIKK